MKKYLLGIIALAVVALAVTLVVRANDSSKENKKAETEMVKEAHECGAAHACEHDKGDKSSCDPAKCANCCDHEDSNCDQGKDHDPAKCATQCPSAKKDAKHDHSKCNH
jgi:hypothetical protein